MKAKSKLQKLLSAVLCLVMLMSMLPTLALAESRTEISRITIMGVTEPVVGEHPRTTFTLASFDGFTTTAGWYYYDDAAVPQKLNSGEVFQSGISYTFFVTAVPRSGYLFPCSAYEDPINGDVYFMYDGNVTVNGDQVVGTVQDDGSLQFSWWSKPAKSNGTYISSVNITGVSAPKAGEKVGDNLNKIKAADASYTIMSKTWWCDTPGHTQQMASSAVFEEGLEYSLNVKVQAANSSYYIDKYTMLTFNGGAYGRDIVTYYSGILDGFTVSKAAVSSEYKVTFNANGHGTAPAARSVDPGDTAVEPEPPTAKGYTFIGWYTDSACKNAFDFDEPVNADITLYAKWLRTIDTVNILGVGAPVAGKTAGDFLNVTAAGSLYSVVDAVWFDSTNEDHMSADQTFVKDRLYKLYVRVRPVNGYAMNEDDTTFLFNDGDLDVNWVSYVGNAENDVYMVTDNFTAEEMNRTIKFNTNGHGTAPAALTVRAGSIVKKPADPTASGYTFGGWYTDAACTRAFDFNTAINSNITLYAKWTKNVVVNTVTFNANGHGTAPAAQSVAQGSKAAKPADLTASGYTFGGWYTDAACTKAFDFNTAINSNITLYAKWTKNVIVITASNVTKNASTKEQSIALNAKASAGTLKYKSDNTKITIKDGKAVVPANFTGKANITITASGSGYATATKTIVLTINKVANTITASNFTKTYSTKAQSFSIGATRKGSGALTYTSDNKSVTVDKAGKVTVKAKFMGKATITIKVAAKGIYKEATKKITVTVNPTKTTLSSVANASGLKMTVKWAKNTVGTGYEIQYSTSKDFSSGNKSTSVTKNTTVSKTITGLTKGKTYYVRIRTYKTVSSVKYCSSWSAVKSVKISK